MTLQEVETLTVPEKIQLVEDIWDSVATSNADLPIPEWQKQELARRKENFLRHPNSGMTWQQVKKSVLENNV
jgi:putative addiction module component (TIGR02574 family)